jgi:hypothetical protein
MRGSQVVGRVGVRIVREGGVYEQRGHNHPPKSNLWSTPLLHPVVLVTWTVRGAVRIKYAGFTTENNI